MEIFLHESLGVRIQLLAIDSLKNLPASPYILRQIRHYREFYLAEHARQRAGLTADSIVRAPKYSLQLLQEVCMLMMPSNAFL